MRILYVTTVGGTMGFFKSIIGELVKEGNVVDIATNEESRKVDDYYRELGCKIFPISTSRSPFSIGNVRAIKQIREISKDYDIVHCHTPLAGAATRIGCKGLRKKGLKVMYTAHGFHFYKGAPMKNWLIYYPIEKICAHWTDVLITINKEDYSLARKNMKAKQVEYVPGVGIDTKKYFDVITDRKKKREEIGVPKDAKVVLSVGELNENKNHRIVIEALGRINDQTIHYVIAGSGEQKENLESLAKKYNVNLHLLGYRKDVSELYKCADLFVHPSLREGLPVVLMEAIASKINCICSNIRGSRDLVKNGLFDPTDVESVEEQILRYFEEDNYIENYTYLKTFDLSCVNEEIKHFYNSETGGYYITSKE